MKKLKTINIENSEESEYSAYRVRNSARAVIFDKDNNIAFIYVPISDSGDVYHVLPGGGIDEGESKEEALARECLEEAGVQVEILAELGEVSEIKKVSELIQNSFCYTAKVVGKKGQPILTESERSKGYTIQWVTIDKAISLMIEEKSDNIYSGYIFEREITILREAKRVLEG